MAAVNQVTGISLPLIVLRLAPVPLAILLVLLLSAAGKVLSGRAWAGPLAAGLFVFVSEIDLDSRTASLHNVMPFLGGGPFISLATSPTFVLGLVFFVPAVVLLAELLSGTGGPGGRGVWVVLFLFLVGAAGAKVYILPLVLGALVLFVFWRYAAERVLDRTALAAGALAAAVVGVFALTFYRGASVGESGTKLEFASAIKGMYPLALVEQRAGSWFWVPAVLLGLLALLTAPLSGLVWFVRGGRAPLARRHVLLLSLFVVGLLPFFVLTLPAFNHLVTLEYGLLAACFVSAEGIVALWGSRRATTREHVVLWGFAAGVCGTLLALWYVTQDVLGLDGLRLYASWLAALCVLAAWAVVAGRRRLGGAVVSRLLLVTVLGAAALNIPLDYVAPALSKWSRGEPQYAQGDLTPALHDGLTWIRDHTDPDDVVAVNAQRTAGGVPDNYYVSAFAERRVFLEGWLYTARSFRLGFERVRTGAVMPYPHRFALNNAVFQRADRHALQILARDYGVRYLVVDKVHAMASPELARVARRVYTNRDVDVYAVPAVVTMWSSGTPLPAAASARVTWSWSDAPASAAAAVASSISSACGCVRRSAERTRRAAPRSKSITVS